MRILGIPQAEVVPLIRAVSEQDVEFEAMGERFARAAWTGIAEPGDRTAGLLISSLGAEAALGSLVSRAAIDSLLETLSGEIERQELEAGFERWLPRVKSSVAILSLKQAARYSAKLLVPTDPGWPAGLADLGPHAPIALWLRGSSQILNFAEHSISLVGARAATGYGEHVTMEASAGLVDRGFAIVSGAAYGIDGMAHRAALASKGRTIAVLAGGVDRFYPSGHETLLTRIVEDGAVISELPCGAAPTKWRFLQRNRMIAALSQATVVIEAGWRSGSLNTAGHAAAIGRPVGAVPGPVTSAASAGCHRLIREYGAICVTSAADMAQLVASTAGELGFEEDHVALNSPTENSESLRLKDALSARTARGVDELARSSGLPVNAVRSRLGELQLDGQVIEKEAGWVLSSQKGQKAK
ncbi:MAG: DNA-processing protein DprA [Homoserinimonas sp.]|nr:DNA-processing protein DprA [Homoserinimonas sp.]